MRIIAGRFRRRQLLTNPGQVTRPITDRVKESLFENIEQRLIGKRVADVFAGAGTIGLEALSRGAERVMFIENDRVAFDLLRQNIARLQCEDSALPWRADVLRCSFRPKGGQSEEFLPLETIFFDPPYKMVPGMKVETPLWRSLRRLARPGICSERATLVLRVPEHAEYDLPAEWEVEWSMDVSNMILHICRRRAFELDATPGEEGIEPDAEPESVSPI